MRFYESISHLYDLIFPYSPAQKDLVVTSLEDPEAASILEIGCATGSLTLELARTCSEVTGIDIDASMIARAQEKAGMIGSGSRILQMDMLTIEDKFSPGSFDAVCCFGNTLVHLGERAQMLQLFRSVRTLLKEGAPFHLQIINYDRILDEGITYLPEIENESIWFKRDYQYLEAEHRIEFSTTLTEKASGASSSQKLLLYPLRRAELQEMLDQAGFTEYSWYGGFDGSPLGEHSVPLVVTVR